MIQISSVKRYTGVDADTKPTGVPVGSEFFARDTGVWYVYDGADWGAVSATGVLPAGENYVGKVGGTTVTTRATFTRVADTNALAANDGIADLTAAATLQFLTAGRVATGSGTLVGAHLETTMVTCVARIEVDFYDDTITAINDNAPATRLTADRAKFLGRVTFPALVRPTATSDIVEAFDKDFLLPYKCVGNNKLYYIVRTLDAFTPESAQRFDLAFGNIQD